MSLCWFMATLVGYNRKTHHESTTGTQWMLALAGYSYEPNTSANRLNMFEYLSRLGCIFGS